MSTTCRLVSVRELNRRITAGDRVDVWDVRTPGEFASAHVPGSVNVPLGSPDLLARAKAQAAKGDSLFVICQSGGRSQRCCAELAAAGLKNAVSVEGGVGAWAEAGFATERVAGRRAIISLERQVRIAAGTLILIGCALGLGVHSGFFGLAAFVGAGLLFAGVTGSCGLGLLLARMPWNRR